MRRMFDIFRRLADDERGTTLTEFVMTLPIFVMIFIGILQLGTVTAHSVVVDARAYKETWDLAIPVSKEKVSLAHMTPASGGGLAVKAISYEHTRSSLQQGAVQAAELMTYQGLAKDGTLGESYNRALPAEKVLNIGNLDGNLQSSLSPDLIGNSKYAKDLLNESVDFAASGSGALSQLNGFVTGAGIRPAIAAGMRYGAVVGEASDSTSWLNFPVNYRAHFNTLVAPYPMGTAEDELTTTAVTRLTMEAQNPYAEVLGIAFEQPLSSESINVPDLSKKIWVPCGVSGCDAGGP